MRAREIGEGGEKGRGERERERRERIQAPDCNQYA